MSRAPRLQFTKEEAESPELKQPVRKQQKAAAKAAAAQRTAAPEFAGPGFGEFPPAFDPGMSFDNSMAMAPGMGFGGGFGGPGMGFGGGFGGF